MTSRGDLSDKHHEETKGPGYIAHPSSGSRLVWDLSGSVLIGYDIIMVPMQVFNLPENGFFIFMNWVTLLFWSCDIVASFLVGYVHKGHTIMDPRKIARNYMKTWFILDCVIV